VLPRIAFGEVAFGRPAYLWLLVLPALLLAVWIWRLAARRADVRRLARHRLLPVRERLTIIGDLPFWLFLLAAISCLILALAGPQGPATTLRQGGIDLVILQDGSASMRVSDVPGGDRWQRSMRFLRTLGDALSWRNDRVALSLFARIAAPQIRLTTDPNTFFFFLDHLSDQPPFRLEDESSWDTNLERGIHWGLRLIERDEEMYGESLNAPLFIMLSDGEWWSGEVDRAIEEARGRNVPLFVVGVGTLGGARMPRFSSPNGVEERDPSTPLMSRLDRPGLQRIAEKAGGQYFELGRDGDRRIANAIIDSGRRRVRTLDVSEDAEQLYWYFLNSAAILAGFGLIFLRDRTELWIHFIGAGLALVGLGRLLW
jgi:Ca-activated chloride channel family protein